MSRRDGRLPRPPKAWSLLARLLLRGEHGRAVREDAAESFLRDLDRGLGPRRARRRYAANVIGSVWSLGWGGLQRLRTHGALLDAKLGARMLGRQPVLTGVEIVALGLGIPSTLAVHHVMGVLLQPLPIPEGERVVGIRHWDMETTDPAMASVHDLELWRQELGSFEAIGAARSFPMNVYVGDPGAPAVRGAEMTASAFEILRTAPLDGRLLGPADEVRGAPNVVVIGEALWASRFGRDPDIVGQTIRVGSEEHTVVGVMPASFRFPIDDDVWLPLRTSPADYAPGEGPELFVFGRLAEGASMDDAHLEVGRLTERMAAEDPRLDARYGQVVALPPLLLMEDMFSESDPEVLVGQSIIFLLLLLVCGNVGTLMLARTATRTAELSIRTALGASRARLVVQIFTETLVLALAATGVGLVFAEATARWLTELLRPYALLPYWADVTLHPETVLTALGLAALSAVVAGVLPALKATGRGVQTTLQRAASGRSTVRFGLGSTLLIVAEIVLSVGFLAAGATLVRSAFVDTEGLLGFEPERYLRATVRLPWIDPAEHPEYASEEARIERLAATQREVLRRIRAAEGVLGAAMGTAPGVTNNTDRIVLESGAASDGLLPPGTGGDAARPATADALPVVGRVRVHVDYFEGLGRAILAGRDFTAADVAADPSEHRPPVMVNTTFVDQVLGGRSAVGRRFRVATPNEAGQLDRSDWFEIVGVVGRFGTNATNPIRDAAVYYPLAAGEVNPLTYVVELADDPRTFLSSIREIVAISDPEATVERVSRISDVIEAQSTLFRWAFTMQVVLASIAFILSVSGLYALMSFTVSQRTREIGIRTALGARPREIVSAVARRAAAQLAVGLALGAVWTWWLLRGLADDMAVVPVNIPLTIAGTTGIAAAVGIAACASPTLRGIRMQPTEALREG